MGDEEQLGYGHGGELCRGVLVGGEEEEAGGLAPSRSYDIRWSSRVKSGGSQGQGPPGTSRWRRVRQDTGQVGEGVRGGNLLEEGRALKCEGGDQVGGGGGEEGQEGEEAGHSGPPVALLGAEEVVVDVDPGNSCDSRQSSRGQSGDSRGQALPRTNKAVLEVEQGTGGWVGGLLEDKRLAQVGEDGEQVELDDGVGVGELREEADVGV